MICIAVQRYILGRIAHIDEEYLQQLVDAGRVDEIINRPNTN